MNTVKDGVIRAAELDDSPAILAIFQQCDPFAVAETRSDSIGLLDVMEWLESATPHHPMLVFERQGRVVAWCSIEPFYGLPAFDKASELSLYVATEEQHKGVGSLFIDYLTEHRLTIGFTHLIAYIYASNTGSLRFFEKQGFVSWGLLPNIAKNGKLTEDVHLLGRAFSESCTAC